MQAVLTLLQAECSPELMEFATRLADTMLDRFRDEDNGGFFFTAAGREAPVHRLRILQDDATPSGNGVAARALLTLGHLNAEPRYLEAARALLDRSGAELGKYPLGHASLLVALDEYLDPPAQVVIAGQDAAETAAWQSVVRQFDRVHCYALAPGAHRWPAVLGEQTQGGETTAYLCRGSRCLPAIRSRAELEEKLTAPD